MEIMELAAPAILVRVLPARRGLELSSAAIRGGPHTVSFGAFETVLDASPDRESSTRRHAFYLRRCPCVRLTKVSRRIIEAMPRL